MFLCQIGVAESLFICVYIIVVPVDGVLQFTS